MSNYRLGDKVAYRTNPYECIGKAVVRILPNSIMIVTKDYKFIIEPEDNIVAYEKEIDMSDDDIYDMLKLKMNNILHWHSVESIKNDPFPPQILEWVGNNINVRYQQYCNECDIKQAIALAYRSGYLRAKKGRPFKIGGEKE